MILIKNIELYGEYPCLNFVEASYTNVSIKRQANAFAAMLKRKGVQENDRVLLMLPNVPEVLIAFQATMQLGAILVPVNASLNASEVQYIVNHCEPKVLISNLENQEKVNRYANAHTTVYLIDSPTNEPVGELTDDQEDSSICPKEPDDVAAIIYTSGTTGVPKGAMITHGNIQSDAQMELTALGLLDEEGKHVDQGDFPMLVVLPISHIYGMTVTMVAYILGGRIVLKSRFVLEEIFETIQQERVKLFTGVPTMYYHMTLFGKAKEVDVSSVKYWVSGASPLTPEIRLQFEAQFKTQIMEGYGLTESSSGFALQRYGEPIVPGSVGKSIPGTEVGVFDEQDRLLPVGEIGELVIKGPNVMKGYYKMEEETKKVLKDGWLLTGDVGYIDADGNVFLLERKKDLIIRGGFNIYPQEVENILAKHPAVAEVGVIGVEDAAMGETVKAFVALKAGHSATEVELIRFCKDQLATYKIPQSIDFMAELPKNELGKVLKKDLRRLAKLEERMKEV